jgi:hypothetical protein
MLNAPRNSRQHGETARRLLDAQYPRGLAAGLWPVPRLGNDVAADRPARVLTAIEWAEPKAVGVTTLSMIGLPAGRGDWPGKFYEVRVKYLALRMIARVQSLMMYLSKHESASMLWDRLERIEAYLIRRHNQLPQPKRKQ